MIEFQTLFGEVVSRIVLDRPRARALYDLAVGTISLPGDAAECGTFKGGSAKLIAKTSPSRMLHVFDTFHGIPAVTRMDGEHNVGDFSCSRSEVEEFLADCPNIRLYEGLVPDTLEEVKDLTFNLVHLDMDTYIPTIAALDFFWPRVSIGGVIVLDDLTGLYGITKAVHEFESICGVSSFSNAPWQAIFKK